MASREVDVEKIEARPSSVVKEILRVIEELNHLKDVDSILDRVLLEARRMTNSEAGSIFLVEGDALRFSYVHNDRLFPSDESSRHIYTDLTIPMNEKSMVGYAAVTGKPLIIDDAYEIPDDAPYSFNSSFDKMSGFRTTSVMSIPLLNLRGKSVGVMQLINALDGMDTEGARQVRPFTTEEQQLLPLFANNASVAIERGIMTRELLLRMMKMAELRDPSETGAHVQRVGAYSAEIYDQLARKRGVDSLERRRFRDLLRLAAMLHDVGKVGISDLILKKPGKLTDEEFATMRWHTVFGAALFSNSTSELDDLCRDIALNHHERWDGRGYPGHLPENLDQAEELCLSAKAPEDVPLAARITSLADVYDALSSRRCYKDAWPEEKVLGIIKEERGRQFDPEVVDAFLDIHDDVIRAIYNRYQEGGGKVEEEKKKVC